MIGCRGTGKTTFIKEHFPLLPSNCIFDDHVSEFNLDTNQEPIVLLACQYKYQIPKNVRNHVTKWYIANQKYKFELSVAPKF